MRFFLLLAAAALSIFLILRAKRPRDYRSAKFYKTLYRPEGFELGIWGRRRFGRAFSHFVARLIGLGYAMTHPRVLRDIRSNIALLDPAKATFGNAVGVCIQQALNFREYTELGARQPAEVLEMLGEKSGIEHIERARELGKGCLFVTGHLGFFELGGLVMSQMGYPMTALTLPEPTSSLTEWRAGFRKRWGVETVVVGGDAFSAVEITRRLREGAMVALLCDRPFDSNTVTVELPHGRIPFSTSPVLLALLSGAPIVAVSITRQPDGKFAIHADPPMFPEWLPEGREATLAHFTTRLAQDHFPDNPLVPAALLLESAAQACGAFWMRNSAAKPSPLFVASIDAMRILGPAKPGETLDVRVTLVRELGPLAQFEFETSSADRPVSRGRITLSRHLNG